MACNDDTYLSVLACVTGLKHADQTRELEMVEKFFELIARRGASPGPRALVRVGVAYAQVGMWDKALSVFEAIVSYLTGVSHSTQLWPVCVYTVLALSRFICLHPLFKHASPDISHTLIYVVCRTSSAIPWSSSIG